MANFTNQADPKEAGVVTEEAQRALWEKLQREGHRWEFPRELNALVSPGYPPEHVAEYCVRDMAWQKVRLSMKGIPTHEKLDVLVNYWQACAMKNVQKFGDANSPGRVAANYRIKVQVGNYLGALRRGGQLDMNNRVRKYI